MPTFGDYETVGEPVATTDEGGRISTVWQARKGGGNDSRRYAIKCFSPQQRHHREERGGEEHLDADLGLEFLETVKMLKKARSEGGRCLAPIHDFGTSDDGAWYATDFYKRTLKSWIALRGGVDDVALRHVVFSLATGCQSIQRTCGRSHGNVKVSNVFLAGKAQAFRKTPLELVDPRPASLIHAFRPGGSAPGDPSQIAELTELHDLHALGLVILQLVEGRIVRNEHDYNYPIPPSPDWSKLGKEGEHWRELCEQLLGPNLSLSDVRLDALATRYRPSAVGAKLPLIAGGAVAVCALGAGIYFLIPSSGKKFQEHYQAAQSALEATNLFVARKEIATALEYKPQEPAATDLKARIEQRFQEESRQAMEMAQHEYDAKNWDNAKDLAERASKLGETGAPALLEKIQSAKNYQAALASAVSSLQQQDFEGAMQHANEALKLRPNDVTAKNLVEQARNGKGLAAYDGAMKKANAALANRDYPEAIAQADSALAVKPRDADATRLKNEAQRQQKVLAAQGESERNFQTAVAAAQTAFERQDYDTTLTQLATALSIKPNDAAALRLKRDAQLKQGAAATQAASDRNYKKALALAQTAFERQDFTGAVSQADSALAIRPNDDAAGKLRAAAQTRLGEIAAQSEIDQKFNRALAASQAAYGKQDYNTALNQANAALAVRANDASAGKLKSDAEARLREASAQAANDQKYTQAIAAARTAFEKQDYATAIAQADAAMAVRAGDPAAAKIKSDSQARQALLAAQVENDRKYKAAMAMAQMAYEKHDYSTASSQAGAALGLHPGDSAAGTLKANADTKQREQATQADNEKRYNQAMIDAQASFNLKDYAAAAAKADEALGVKPNDTSAANLKSRAIDAKDLQAATAFFDKAEYADAQHLTDQHKGTPAFDGLAKNIAAEQKLLSDAQIDASNADYSALNKLKGQAYSAKPPFDALIGRANTEQANLAALQNLKTAGQWQQIQQKLADLKANGFLRKAPFDDLGTWADQQAQLVQDNIKKLDAQFETLMVQFGEFKPKQVSSPEAKKQEAIGARSIGIEGKDYYTKLVKFLQDQYKQSGWLDKPGDWDKKKTRQKYLQDLLSNIGNRD